MGYHRAGFEVVGVDIKPQPHYPFEFHQADAFYVLNGLYLEGVFRTYYDTGITVWKIKDIDAIHASPPCQRWCVGSHGRNNYPDLLTPTKKRLEHIGNIYDKPFVIENVPKSPIRADFKLRGDMVGLTLIKRERWFEVNFFDSINMPVCYERTGPVITVTGHGTTSGNRQSWKRNIKTQEMREAMGIDWMNRDELSQAIPPAYTEYIGKYLMEQIKVRI